MQELNLKQDVFISSDEDEMEFLELMNCSSLESATRLFHNLTGREVVDRRDSRDSEYTNVNAQRDVDFWNEEPIV